jgi:chitinase
MTQQGEASKWLALGVLGAMLAAGCGVGMIDGAPGDEDGPEDSGAPTVLISSPSSGLTHLSTAPLSIVAIAEDDRGVMRVDFYDGPILKASVPSAPFVFVWNPTLGDNGMHVWRAQAFDEQGNNSTSLGVYVTIDIAAPDDVAPSVAISSPSSGTTFTNAQTVSVVAAASDNVGVSRVDFYDGAVLKGAASTSPFTLSWTCTLSDNGSHTFTAQAFDAAGNSTRSSPVTLVVNIAAGGDTAPPTAAISSPGSNASYTSAQTLTIVATASDNVGVQRVEFYDAATLVATDTGSPYQYSWTFGLADNGAHSFTAKAFDAAGNSVTSTARVLTVNIAAPDPTPPTVAITTPATNTTYTSAQSVNLVATANDNVGIQKVEFYDGATLKRTEMSAPYEHAFTFTHTDNGAHSFTAKAFDTAGNTTTSFVRTLTVNVPLPDTTAPTVSISSPGPSTYTSAQGVVITATAGDNVGIQRVEFYDGVTLKTTDTTSPYTYTWNINGANNGAHSFTAKAFDAAGNNTTSTAVTLTVAISGPGSAVLEWDANTEGDLAGYRVYYGTSSGAYGAPLPAGPNPTYTVSNLASGTYYFAVTAYDTGGYESLESNEVWKTIP